MLLLLASATTDKLRHLPQKFWINCAIFVGIILAAVIAWRFLRDVNKIVLGIVIFLVCAIIGFNWIYERNEPEFLTPYIDPIAQFFPTKGSYEVKQTTEPGEKPKPGSTKPKPGEKTPAPAPTPAKPTPAKPAPAKP